MKYQDSGVWLYQKELAKSLNITVQYLHKLISQYKIETEKMGARTQVLRPSAVKDILRIKNLRPAQSVIGVHLIKGGVGKTTLVHGLAARAAAFGHKTLMIDLDQQANLTTSFDVNPINSTPTLYTAWDVNVKQKINDAVVNVDEYLDLIPSNMKLAAFDGALLVDPSANVGTLLATILDPIADNYDLIIIDCPPALSKVTSAVHAYCNQLILPVDTDSFSMEGLEQTYLHIERIKKGFPTVSPEVNIVFNKFDARHKKIGIEIISEVKREYGNELLQSIVGISKHLPNSIAQGKGIWSDRSQRNQALEDIHQLMVELLGLEEWQKDWKNNKLTPLTIWKKTQASAISSPKKLKKHKRKEVEVEANL